MNHLNTPISEDKKIDQIHKNAKTEPRSYPMRKMSLNNFNEVDNLNIFSDSNPVKVVVRFRPMNDVENEMLLRKFGRQCVQFKSHDTVEVLNPLNELKTFTFDCVFDTESSQSEIFESTAKPLISDVLKGYNATIFTYGQSGSGKTFTMYGEDILDEATRGIIPRAINEIFNFINDEKNKEIKFELKFSMLEIYMENLYDLLNPDIKSNELKIKEHSQRGIYVENLSEIYITSQEEFLFLIHEAEKCRSVSETSLNKNSSRSHLLFQLQITQKLQDDTERCGALNLIDLAGSEKVSKTHAMGTTLEEAKKINLSLSNLGNVIYALASNNDYIPYRDSKLTRILQDSLGGNSKTMLIVNCSVHSYNAEETISTLQFAKRAKRIKNKVRINIKRSTEQLEAIIEYLTEKLHKAFDEIEKLKMIKRENSISGVGNLEFFKVEDTKYKNEVVKENNTDFFIYSNADDDKFALNNRSQISSGNEKNHFEILSEMKRKGSLQSPQKATNNVELGENNFYQKFVEIKTSEKNEKRINSFKERDLNSNSENFLSENLLYKERQEFENIIKIKNKEIEELKIQIENLNIQNAILKEKIDQMGKDLLIENLITQTENSMKEFIQQLTSSYDNLKDVELNQLKENLVEMKTNQIEAEDKYLEIIKEITEFKEAEFSEKLNYLYPKFNNLSNNQNENIGPKFTLDVSKNQSVKNLNSKMILIDNFSLSGGKNINNVNGKNENNNSSKGNINEKEMTLFDNLDDDLNISINTCNKVGLKNQSSSRNTLKFTVKRHFVENKDNNSANNNLFNDSLSNISSHNKNLINVPRDKSTIKSNRNTRNTPDIPMGYISLTKENTKPKTEKLFSTNFIKKTNTFNFNFVESDERFKNKSIKHINNVEDIENLSNFTAEKFLNVDNGNLNNNYKYSNNLFNTIHFNSDDKVSNKVPINYHNNACGNEGNRKNKNLVKNNDFNLSCEDLFNQIESKMKKNFENILRKTEETNKTEGLNSNNNNKNINENNKIEEIICRGNLKHHESKLIKKNNQDNLGENRLKSPSGFKSFEKENPLNSNNKDINFYEKVILSYKKIFEKNRFYSRKILEDFLRNLDIESIHQHKNEEKNENTILYNIKNNYTDENKSTIRTNDKKSEFNLGNNMNLLNNTTIQDDFFSVNDKIDGKDHMKILNDLENPQSKKEIDFTLNKNTNLAFDNIANEVRNYGVDSRMVIKLKNGFVSLMLKNIYYEKITLELLTRLSIDLKIFNNETFYRKKLTLNFPSFISIFENYLSILEELKKIKFRKEYEESKANAYQTLINNINQMNPNFRNSSGREDSDPTNNNNQNLNKFIENETNKNLEDVEEETENSYFKTNKSVEKTKKNNSNRDLCGVGINSYSNNNGKRIGANLVKSISRHPSTLHNNITFCNYGFFNSKHTNSQGFENSISLANYNIDNKNIPNNNFICDYCNNVNNFNLINTTNFNNNNNGNSLNASQYIPPFKLVNNINPTTNRELLNTETYDYKSNSPIKKTPSSEFFYKKNMTKSDFIYKYSNEKENFLNDIHLIKKFNKSPDKELVANLKKSALFISGKTNSCDINRIASINNTPVGVNSFNLTSPNNLGSNVNFNFNNLSRIDNNCNINQNNNNYLLTSEKERISVKGRYENFRQSLLSNTSNRKINEDGFYYSELRILRKENLLLKSCFESMTNEISNFKFYEKNKEEALEKFYDENRVIFEKEVTCFWKALNVFKEIFFDQIKIKENKINEMSKIFDDMVIGENSNLIGNNISLFGVNDTHSLLNLDKPDPSKLKEDFLRSLAYKKKNKILSKETNVFKDKEFLKLAEAFYKEEGTATKKLDYVTIEIKDNPEIVSLRYGSGLNKTIPTKSPLNRGFTTSLVGDEGVDNLSNDEN